MIQSAIDFKIFVYLIEKMHRSSVSKVVLRKVNLKTSGTFRCEVTTRSDARNTKRFDSETREERLVVVGKFAYFYNYN